MISWLATIFDIMVFPTFLWKAIIIIAFICLQQTYLGYCYSVIFRVSETVLLKDAHWTVSFLELFKLILKWILIFISSVALRNTDFALRHQDIFFLLRLIIFLTGLEFFCFMILLLCISKLKLQFRNNWIINYI
jgi:hypothetical protein